MKWNKATEKVLSQTQINLSEEPSLPKSKTVDINSIEVGDPNLLNYPDLLSKYNPKSLLERYEKTQQRGKFKLIRTIDEKQHICKAKFHTRERSLTTEGTHPHQSMKATYEACQKLLQLLFPKTNLWVDLVNHIDSLKLYEVSAFQIPKNYIEAHPHRTQQPKAKFAFPGFLPEGKFGPGLHGRGFPAKGGATGGG